MNFDVNKFIRLRVIDPPPRVREGEKCEQSPSREAFYSFAKTCPTRFPPEARFCWTSFSLGFVIPICSLHAVTWAFQASLDTSLSALQRLGRFGEDGSWARLTARAGKHESKLERFARLGISTIKLEDVVAVDKSFDVVVDCTGSDSGLPLAIRLVRPRGTIGL